MKIKDWVCEERPREKMLSKGAGALGNAELLAILLRIGTPGKNVLEVAQTLLSQVGGSLTKASQMSVEELCRIDGIGSSKAISVVAALELGKRLCSEAPDLTQNIVRGSCDVYREMKSVMRGLSHEECWVFFLSRKNKIISKERLSSGGQSETIVDIKSVARRAIDLRACSVILSHNHPSGDPHPGTADVSLTKQLKEALELFDIKLLDHVVVSDGIFYSFADESEHFVK